MHNNFIRHLVSLISIGWLAGCSLPPSDEHWQQLSKESFQQLKDQDKDGVVAAREQCQQTQLGLAVDNLGCSTNDSRELHEEVKLYFPPREDQLDEAEQYALKNFINSLKSHPSWQLKVEGYADTQGDLLYNQVLGQRRVDLVARQLTEALPDHDLSITPHVVEGAFSSPATRVSEVDQDGDGIKNALDRCPATDAAFLVDEQGCTQFEERLVDTALSVRYQRKSAAIDPVYFPKIQQLADFINRYNVAQVNVVGHTSATGAAWYNRKLSAERAGSVRQMLIDDFGIPAEKLTATGKGMSQLLDPRNDEAAHSVNRRVEIVLSEVLKIEKKRPQQATPEENRRITVTATAREASDNLRWHVFIMEQQADSDKKNTQDQKKASGGW